MARSTQTLRQDTVNVARLLLKRRPWLSASVVVAAGLLLLALPIAQATTFGSPIRITTNTGDSSSPSGAAVGNYVYVAWDDNTPVSGSGTASEVWLRVSSNNGASFGSALRISTNAGESRSPSVAADGRYVYVAWADNTPVSGSGSASEIWMRMSSNYGAGFSPAIRITTNAGESAFPFATAGGYVYVAWEDDTPVPDSSSSTEIWLRASSNRGVSLGSAIRISRNSGVSVMPCVATNGSRVYVVWEDNTPVAGSGSEAEIWLKGGIY
jgi:hypothetical protein